MRTIERRLARRSTHARFRYVIAVVHGQPDKALARREDVETARMLVGVMERSYDRVNGQPAYVQRHLDELQASFDELRQALRGDTPSSGAEAPAAVRSAD